MLTRRSDTSARFTRKDVPRLAIAAGILILALTAILGADILPEAPLNATVGQLATRDIVAPRAVDFESKVQTDAAAPGGACTRSRRSTLHVRERDRRSRPTSRSRSSERVVARSTRRSRPTSAPRVARRCSKTAVAGPVGRRPRRRWSGSTPHGWAAVRTEAARVLDATLRTELRDTEVAETRSRLSGRMAGGLDEAERMLAAELISPLVVPNSSFSSELTNAAKRQGRPKRSSRSRSRSARARSSSATGRS